MYSHTNYIHLRFRNITERLYDSGAIIGIKLLDHIIIGDDVYYSFKENDEVPF